MASTSSGSSTPANLATGNMKPSPSPAPSIATSNTSADPPTGQTLTADAAAATAGVGGGSAKPAGSASTSSSALPRAGTPTTPDTAPPPTAALDKHADDSSKLKTFVGILKKFIGVTDIAAVRFSLPPQLLEPVPNLEYWNYLDRPEMFASMGDAQDPLGRMLGVMRFWFTKDLKYVKGKPCKPYNSTLGEFFRCSWDVEDTPPPIQLPDDKGKPLDSATTTSGSGPVKVTYLTEQTSHHPPVSAFYVDCPAKGISARGFDQISAKFTGTSIRVAAGAHNLGIFVTLHSQNDEQYQLTHPAAHLGGFLRGSLNVTVADHCYLTCPQTKLKVILHYLEESWLGKTQNRVEGIIFRYDPENDNKTKIKEVSEADIVAKVDGCWHDKLYYTLNGTRSLLIDLQPLTPLPKQIPPEELQLPNESRRFWASVTQAIKAREFSRATTLKLELEERQRQKAAERKAKGEEWQPRFFRGVFTPVGRPELSEDGKAVLADLRENVFDLKEADVTGA